MLEIAYQPISIVALFSFRIDWVPLLIILTAIPLLALLARAPSRFEQPHISFSSTDFFVPETWKVKWHSLPKMLLWASLSLFALAATDPRIYYGRTQDDGSKPESKSSQTQPVEGIAIYLVVDRSGSMREVVPTSRRKEAVKIELLKEVTKEFILGDTSEGLGGRPNDMIGLIAFARGADVLSPLTLDHKAVLEELEQLKPVSERTQDGTSIGYAIFKTANMIAATRHYAEDLVSKGEPAYTIKNSIMILITDGMQDPNPLDKGKRLRNMDVPEAAAYAKKEGIKLYIINVEPKLSSEEYAPYRNIMQRAARSTGGEFFMIDQSGSLDRIYQQIDSLEKSVLPAESAQIRRYDERPDLFIRFSFYPYLIALGILALLVSIFLQTTLLRRAP